MPTFRSILLLLLHLGCLAFTARHRHRHRNRRRRTTQSILTFLRNLFASKHHHISPPIHSIPSPSSSTRSLRVNPQPALTDDEAIPTAIFSGHINPCPLCGEIFPTSTLLEQHRSVKHAVSDLLDGENIVRIIFQTGWPENSKTPTIHRILKIHNGPKTIARFEEHRESIKSRAAKKIQATLRDQRCAVDGNELLRFCSTTFICGLDAAVCVHPYCGACGIIRGGFSHKEDGVATFPTSWRAHAAVPEDLEQEFSFMGIKRALLVCRVIAGRVGCDPGAAEKGDPGFDSLEGSPEELLVFNPTAVLPCFVIVYTAA